MRLKYILNFHKGLSAMLYPYFKGNRSNYEITYMKILMYFSLSQVSQKSHSNSLIAFNMYI